MHPLAAPVRPARSWAGAFLTLAALLALAPGVAEAGCGSHARSARLLGLDGLIDEGSLPESTPVGPIGPRPGKAPPPCSGAFCSGSPAAPSPSTSTPAPPVGLWAILTGPPASVVRGSLPRPLDEPSRRPSGRGPSVFHPPRPIAPASA